MLGNTAIGMNGSATHPHRISTYNTNSPLWLHNKNEEKEKAEKYEYETLTSRYKIIGFDQW
jgi:hypothetical protein